jgi:EAL domain-containing protein (putative c-di-GMP-specific phosphodiesterase class I)
MSRAMNKKVVAEGVEELGAIEFLREARCDEVQGFYYSRPLFEPEFKAWMGGYESRLH